MIDCYVHLKGRMPSFSHYHIDGAMVAALITPDWKSLRPNSLYKLCGHAYLFTLDIEVSVCYKEHRTSWSCHVMLSNYSEYNKTENTRIS